ncbi:DUF6584 family protein [Pilimelia columellifera]|uniref:DUF6584 family protein n=1 Tax=Pilimelia columellifera TaxID=706574 RepID=UPI0031D30B32
MLTRIADDLSRGRTYPALQRLATLTALDPTDREARALRAEVNRGIGNVVEAGRWGFLTEQVSLDEVAAFERAYPSAAKRVQALRLAPYRNPEGVGPLARQRLADLWTYAEHQGLPAAGTPPPEHPPDPDRWWHVLPILVVLAVVLGLMGIGLVTVLSAIF